MGRSREIHLRTHCAAVQTSNELEKKTSNSNPKLQWRDEFITFLNRRWMHANRTRQRFIQTWKKVSIDKDEMNGFSRDEPRNLIKTQCAFEVVIRVCLRVNPLFY